MNNLIRRTVLNDPRFDLDKYARSRGFPDSLAMETVLKAGVELKEKGFISAKMVDKVAKCYSPALAGEIKSTTQRINDIAKTHGVYHATNHLVTRIAGPGNEEAGRELIDHYQNADYSTRLLERRSATEEEVQHAPHDPLSVRAIIERAVAAEQPVDDRPAALQFADILERVTDKQEQIATEPEAFTLRDHISHAFDWEVTGEQADNLESSLDLLDGVSPETQNERYQQE